MDPSTYFMKIIIETKKALRNSLFLHKGFVLFAVFHVMPIDLFINIKLLPILSKNIKVFIWNRLLISKIVEVLSVFE